MILKPQKTISINPLSLPYKYSKHKRCYQQFTHCCLISDREDSLGKHKDKNFHLPRSLNTLLLGTTYELPEHYADFAQTWVTAQTSRPENTRNRSEKNQQGCPSPSFEMSRLEKIPLYFLNLMHGLETLWPSLLSIPPPTAVTQVVV